MGVDRVTEGFARDIRASGTGLPASVQTSALLYDTADRNVHQPGGSLCSKTGWQPVSSRSPAALALPGTVKGETRPAAGDAALYRLLLSHARSRLHADRVEDATTTEVDQIVLGLGETDISTPAKAMKLQAHETT